MGGYQWIYGGPTTPLEALEDEFGNDFPFKFIEEVAESISDEAGMWDWTPKPGPEFYGDEEELNPEGKLSPEKLLDWLKSNQNSIPSMTERVLVSDLVQWFHYFYEDPQNEMPHDKEDGKYVYVYGGPYDAEIEIRESFANYLSDEVISEAGPVTL